MSGEAGGDGGGAIDDASADAGEAIADAATDALLGDPHNCGSAGHDCLGGGCEAGMCLPYAFVGETAPTGIAVDPSGGAYWANQGTAAAGYSDGEIRHVSLTDLTATTVASPVQAPLGVATDGVSFFVSTEGTLTGPNSSGDGVLFSCPMAGCGGGGTVLATGQYGAIDPRITPTALFWSNIASHLVNHAPVPNDTLELSLGDGGVSTFHIGGDLAADEWNLYVGGYGGTGSAPVLTSVPLDGGSASTMTSLAPNGAYAMTIQSGSFVYWSRYQGDSDGGDGIWRCAVPDCAGGPTPFHTATNGNSGYVVETLAADDASVFWAEPGTSPTEIRTCTTGGGGCVPMVLAVSSVGAFRIAVGEKAIYWTGGQGTVMRLAR